MKFRSRFEDRDGKPVPWVLIFNGKHGNGYYLVRSKEELNKCFLKELLDKWYSRNRNYYFFKYDESDIKEKKEEVEKKKKEFDLLKSQGVEEESLRYFKDQLTITINQYTDRVQVNRDYNLAKKAAESKDPVLAARYMEGRRGYEYESWELEELSVVTDEDIENIIRWGKEDEK